MKKLSLICLLAVLFASISNPAKASPVPKDDNPAISATVLNDMATPVVMKYEAMAVAYLPEIPATDAVIEAPSEYQVPVKVILNKEPLAPDGRLWLYRHYFNPIDLKKYPEYTAGKLSDGFPSKIDRPAR